jgi:hypothetical protein
MDMLSALAIMAAVAMTELFGNSSQKVSSATTEVTDASTETSSLDDSDNENKEEETLEVETSTSKRKADDQHVIAVSPEISMEQYPRKRPRSSPMESPVRRLEQHRRSSPVSMIDTPRHHGLALRASPPRFSPDSSASLPPPSAPMYLPPNYRSSTVVSHYNLGGPHPPLPSSSRRPLYSHYGSPYPSPPHSAHTRPSMMHHSRHHAAHRVMPVANCYENAINSSGLPKALSFRKVCSKCGKIRGEHGELGFGNKCVFQECGKCGAGAEAHQKAMSPMGILCRLTVEEGATPGAAEAYERKIRELAVRAELQKSIQDDKRERVERLAQMATHCS